MDEDQPTLAAVAGDPLIGRVLEGRYRLTRRIASGGMGLIYLAEQRGLEREVAVKVLNLEAEGARRPGAPEPRWRERFFREAKLCSRLSHPNTVRIYDYGQTEDDVYFIAMEYIEGRTLTAVLREGPLDPLRAVTFALQVCASLAEAHGLGLVHRDLKPDNLIVSRHTDGVEFLKVLDFGIAKDIGDPELPTEAGVVYGSPGYMSPEQILEQPLTPRSDIYGLGAILFKMLTGTGLFGSGNPVAALTRHVTTQPLSFAVANPDVRVPASLEWVTRQCVAKSPDDRFGSMVELGRALRVCELELRGILTVPAPLSLSAGALVLPPALDEQLRRFGGENPSTVPPPHASLPPPEPYSQPTLQTGRMAGPALLVLGGLVPLAGGAALLVVLLLLASWIAIRVGQTPTDTGPAPIENPRAAPASAGTPGPTAPTAPRPAEGRPELDDPRVDRPSPAPGPPTRPRPRAPDPAPTSAPAPSSTPTPTPTPAPAPAPGPAASPDPGPARAPDDPTRRGDLRNPFEDD